MAVVVAAVEVSAVEVAEVEVAAAVAVEVSAVAVAAVAPVALAVMVMPELPRRAGGSRHRPLRGEMATRLRWVCRLAFCGRPRFSGGGGLWQLSRTQWL